MIAILYVIALLSVAWSINWELKVAFANLIWMAELDRLEGEFAFWWKARKSPIMIQKIVARRVLRESFVIVRM